MRNYIEDAPPTDESLPLLTEMSQETLLELLHISDISVRMNSAGKLTRDQQSFVRDQMKTDEDGVRLLSTIFLSTAILLALIFIMQGLAMSSLILGGGVFLAAFAYYAYSRYSKHKRDLTVRVGKAVGDLRLINSSNLRQWGLLIDNKFFPISEGLAQKFDGYRYPFVAAYYTLGTNTLLSMEVIAPEKRKNDEISGEVEMALDSWEKPKNTLAIDDNEAPSEEMDAEAQGTEKASTSGPKRRF